MKLAIMQPYFLPYIGYFQLINAVDKFVLFDDVNFINRGWINRNRILVHGKAHIFTVPLREASQNKLIKDIQVADSMNWIEKIKKTFELNYKKAPYFQDVYGILRNIISARDTELSSLILRSISKIMEYLDINTQLVETSSIYSNEHLKGQDRIIDICNKELADHYINSIGGMELYSKQQFHKEGIRLNFLKSLPIEYKQFQNEFVPWLSIIDVLMFNSQEEIKRHLYRFELE
jgi:hypothetical protein